MENIFSTIYNLESSLIDPGNTKSADELSPLFADDFTEFRSSGKVYYKPEKIEKLISEANPTEYTISNYGLKILSDNMILATFRVTQRMNGDNSYTSLCSSIWRKSDIGEWQIFFHQETLFD